MRFFSHRLRLVKEKLLLRVDKRKRFTSIKLCIDNLDFYFYDRKSIHFIEIHVIFSFALLPFVNLSTTYYILLRSRNLLINL